MNVLPHLARCSDADDDEGFVRIVARASDHLVLGAQAVGREFGIDVVAGTCH